jgi:hypothetical protein
LSSILYYITGHGFGHAVRSNQVIRRLLELRPDLKVHVRTTAPAWLFVDPLARIIHSPQSMDVGVVQKDSLDMDLDETLRACQALRAGISRTIDRELSFIRENRIELISGDIPPLCFEIASRANIPSVAISNFIWSWIYRAYTKEYPGFVPLIDEMEGFYSKATLALTLPYSCDMEIFPTREPIPWIARTSSLTKEEARAKFGLPGSAPIVLLSFGGLGLQRLSLGNVKRLRKFFFIATDDAHRQDGNLLVLPNMQHHYEDLLRAADVIVTKPGYGIVADAISHKVSVLYTDRGDFPECRFLVQALNELATAEFIAQDELLSGAIGDHLERLLLKRPNWPQVSLDGATVAAERILSLLDRYPRSTLG